MADAAAAERHEFQAEVARVLDIVFNSLYSKREIFLRELISNASDACDKLRYEAQLDASLMKDDADLKILHSLGQHTAKGLEDQARPVVGRYRYADLHHQHVPSGRLGLRTGETYARLMSSTIRMGPGQFFFVNRLQPL